MHKLKLLVPATTDPMAGSVGRSLQHWAASAAAVVWAVDVVRIVGFDCTSRPMQLCPAGRVAEDSVGSTLCPAWIHRWSDCVWERDAEPNIIWDRSSQCHWEALKLPAIAVAEVQ